MNLATQLLIDSPQGEGRWLLHPAAESTSSWWLLLGHGAGGSVTAPDLTQLAATLPARGIAVALFEQPWVRAGKKVASRPAQLDEAWLAGVEALQAAYQIGSERLAVGGRSAGARVACRTADRLGATTVVNLAFPLHPPGSPQKSRLAELTGTTAQTLTFQGERDPFGGTDELLAALAGGEADRPVSSQHRVVRVPRAAHDLKIPMTVLAEQQLHDLLPDEVGAFLLPE